MPQKKSPGVEEFEYKAEMKQLLHLIVHSLYTHPEIFLRELISNASDALNKVRFRQLTEKNVLNPDLPLRVNISLDSKAKRFSIEDTGIGMTKEDLIDRIGTVASSGTLEFLQKMKEEKRALDGNLIGQFGIGLYSVFMVTDEITIETRYASTGSKGYLWQSGGEGKYTIEQIDRKQRGTKISFKLKKDAAEFSEEFQVIQVIKKYSNFVDFPIYVGAEEVNTVSALWHRKKDDVKEEELTEFYKFISNDFNAPLGHLHMALEGRVNFKALVFVPETAPMRLFHPDDLTSMHLYSSKVFIQDDCKELLPEHLRFVAGVVDTEDLPLNVSREVTQSSPVMTKIKDVLTGKMLGLLEGWAKKDQEKYDKFYKNFGPLFKTGVNTDFKNKERIIELLRFESSKTEAGKTTSLKEYVSGMKPDQKEIYYLSGEHRDSVERNPNLEYFKKNDIEVLFLLDPVDLFVMPSIPEYDKKALKTIEKADIDLAEDKDSEKKSLKKDSAEKIIARFKEVLGDKVEDVIESKRLVDSAATLVVGKEGMDAQMEQMMKLMNKEYAGSKKILEINISHPLIKNLSSLSQDDANAEIVKSCILQTYEGALLVHGDLESKTEFVNRMTDIMERATH
jgi:molecular chaperone HtpG